MKCFGMQLAALAHIGGGVSLLIVLSSCAANSPTITLLEPSHPASLSDFLSYFHHAKSLDPAELHQLYIQEEEAFFHQNDSESVVHLALLSLLQAPKLRTTSRSIDLLKTYIYEDNPDDQVKDFISFLHHILSQSRYCDQLYEQAKEQLNTALKEHAHQVERYELMKRQLNQLEVEERKQRALHKRVKQALHKEKQTVENLRQQIEQLKTIEKTLNERKQERSPST